MANRHYVTFPEQDITVQARAGENLLDVIQAAGIYIEASCGGIGRCGKCKVYIDGAKLLACETIVTKDLSVFIPSASAEQGYEILIDEENDRAHVSTPDGPKPEPGTADEPAASGHDYAIAIDIGTTTIAVKLIDLTASRTVATAAAVNSQRPFGADVITRIGESMDDASKLSELITAQLDEIMASLISDAGVLKERISKVVIAGNTTMSYILLNLPCRSLGLVPFEPAYQTKAEYSYDEVFGKSSLPCSVYIMPFISAFVGGDITSGLLTLEAEDDFMLIDMGTNGELVYKKDGMLRCTSTAAGPAFEGGNISCGMGSTEGAISDIKWQKDHFVFKTIGGAEPVGICGSGLLDLIASCAKEGFIDETGHIEEGCAPVTKEGIFISANKDSGQVIYLTQKDIREFQLAKSAIRTGLEILISESGDVLPERVYLAGGFGQHLNPQSALSSGLLPAGLGGHIVPAGNSSLAGAVLACIDPAAIGRASALTGNALEINLAAHPKFNDLFMDYMIFE
jgi:uncharacterized 2Fe-2S/4Fe-4S cluster protein (DUF4445 family)